MTLCTVCVDQERGRYVAFVAEDPVVHAESYTSTDEALGFLIKQVNGTEYSKVDKVIDLDVEWAKKNPNG